MKKQELQQKKLQLAKVAIIDDIRFRKVDIGVFGMLEAEMRHNDPMLEDARAHVAMAKKIVKKYHRKQNSKIRKVKSKKSIKSKYFSGLDFTLIEEVIKQNPERNIKDFPISPLKFKKSTQ